jgi:hypothetical protein
VNTFDIVFVATNAVIRQILRAIFLETGSLNWSNFIPQIETNINDRSAVSTGKPRKEIYEGLHNESVREKALKLRREAFAHQSKDTFRWVKL